MIPAKQFDLCPWNKLVALPHMGWQHAGWFASYVVNAKNILEWGCGGSTLWMAMMNTKACILAVEHDVDWWSTITLARKSLHAAGIAIASATVVTAQAADSYSKNDDVEAVHPYDLIFVDGIERPACLAASYDLLQRGGVVFLHDSQRPQYTKAKLALLEREGMTLIDERCDDSWVNQRAGMWAAQKS